MRYNELKVVLLINHKLVIVRLKAFIVVSRNLKFKGSSGRLSDLAGLRVKFIPATLDGLWRL
jgi:hypothetical protein